MLEHATHLESVAVWLCHDVLQIISATLVGTNTSRVVDLLEGMFGVDLSTRDDEDDHDEEEVEPIISEEEEHLPEVGTTTHATAQSADIAELAQPPVSSSTTTTK